MFFLISSLVCLHIFFPEPSFSQQRHSKDGFLGYSFVINVIAVCAQSLLDCDGIGLEFVQELLTSFCLMHCGKSYGCINTLSSTQAVMNASEDRTSVARFSARVFDRTGWKGSSWSADELMVTLTEVVFEDFSEELLLFSL